MHYDYKSDEKYLKLWFLETYSPLILIKSKTYIIDLNPPTKY